MNREEELTDILQKVDRGQMDIAVAFDQILRLFSVSHFYSVGDIVPYTNTRGNTKMAQITEFKQIERNGKWWFYGIDTVTKAKVYYPEHLSRALANCG